MVSKDIGTGSTGWLIGGYSNTTRFGVTTPAISNIAYDPSSASLNTWYHGAVTADNSGTTNWAVFTNGISVATGSRSVGSTSNNFVIGADQGGSASPNSPGAYFPGLLAEIGVWNTVLTNNEIKSLATGILPYQVRPASLVGYWPLWGLTSPEPDLSGNAHNGTLTGTSYATHAPVSLFLPQQAVQYPATPPVSGASQQLLLMGCG
jgi:hypothetical protein